MAVQVDCSCEVELEVGLLRERRQGRVPRCRYRQISLSGKRGSQFRSAGGMTAILLARITVLRAIRFPNECDRIRVAFRISHGDVNHDHVQDNSQHRDDVK